MFEYDVEYDHDEMMTAYMAYADMQVPRGDKDDELFSVSCRLNYWLQVLISMIIERETDKEMVYTVIASAQHTLKDFNKLYYEYEGHDYE